MATKKAQMTGPAVVRRYRAAGECRELGIACIPHGYILVEQLDDGTYRMADNQEADLLEPDGVATAAEDTATEAPDEAAPVVEPEPTADASDPTPAPTDEPAADEEAPADGSTDEQQQQ